MFAFRALNETDLDNYKKGKGLISYDPQINPFGKDGTISNIITHIRYGSDAEKSACWISACKNFRICATEYAIPQNGDYNTSSCRKPIAVINLSNWLGNDAKNYTVFLDGNQNVLDGLCISKDYPDPDDVKVGVYNRSVQDENGKRIGWSKDCLERQVKDFRKAVENQSSNIQYGIMDCSFYRIKNTSALSELDLYQMGQNNNSAVPQYGILAENPTAVENGIARTSAEILFYREIPRDMVVHILTPLEQDMVYLAGKDGSKVLDDIISGKIPEIVSQSNDEPLIDFLSQTDNIEEEYHGLVTVRRGSTRQILGDYGYTDAFNSIPEEDGITVLDLSADKSPYEMTKKEIYDLLAVSYEGKIYTKEAVKELLSKLEKENVLTVS